ncbi:c-type cytochrome biogenesis protein CcmI [Moraxella haemolytica]|uniref:c-type cytochrome biogenesis protein CcmI n=1 Tax=Moraxella haemolytica TaxID=2904119 RepID=UPI0025437A1E|nr:c-type cytochrome biogenesis protein CcmI [Moraxella sp. ZY171148]WII95855.1 c-type cytochrome biogenesis protein CcmI [Moraxella sp. ZY171148]
MSQSLLLFFTLCAVLAVLVALVVIFPWLKSRRAMDNRLMAVNVEVFHHRIAELDADKQAGVIDEAYYHAQSTELKRQLIAAQKHEDRYAPVGTKSRLIVMVWIPLLAALAYLTTADRTPVFTLWEAQDRVGQVADDLLTGKIDTPPEWATKDSAALISAMQTNVHTHAYDANRWMRLSELFTALDAKPQALEALARANRLEPDNVEIAMTYAQASFFMNNGSLDPTVKEIVLGILRSTPEHEGAQMMMAMGEIRAGNFVNAKAWVHKLRSNIAAKSGDRSEALASIDTLLENINTQEAKAAQGVKVGVGIDTKLMPQIQEGDVLFISIVSSKGGAPYAVKRLPVNQIQNGQFEVSLSDLDAMMPERTLTVGRENDELVVNARISHSGGAISESGDLSANPVPLTRATNAVFLTISQVIP